MAGTLLDSLRFALSRVGELWKIVAVGGAFALKLGYRTILVYCQTDDADE